MKSNLASFEAAGGVFQRFDDLFHNILKQTLLFENYFSR